MPSTTLSARKTWRWLGALAALLVAVPGAPVPAADPAMSVSDANAEEANIEEVVVSGEQPGPGLWKVTRGDHTLWIIGTLLPLPQKMTWRSRQVESVIARSKEIILPESAKPNIGFFRGIRLLPAVLRARYNPDGATLEQILTPELYARWSALKAAYIGNDRSIEKWRPMFAGMELYSRALAKSGLTQRSQVWPVVSKAARKQGVPVTDPTLKFDLDNPRQAIRDFTETPRERDVACLAATIERLETDLDAMKQRANAWAVGDVEALQHLPFPSQEATCREALTSAPALQEEFTEIKTRARRAWLEAVEAALARNDVTLAILPIGDLLSPNGRLAQLAARGYEVESP